MRPNEINQLLVNDILNVCQYLLPNGKKSGGYFECGSVNGEEGQSLKVYLSGSKTGKYQDYANPKEKHGDLIDLWCDVRGKEFKEVIQEVKDYLNIDDTPTYHQFKKKEFTPPIKPKCSSIKKESLVGTWYKNTRLISEETLKAYKIGIKDEIVVFPYLFDGKLMMYKTRDMQKEWDDQNDKKYIGTNKDPHWSLFGWQCIPDSARAVCIVEGENDVLACYEQNIPALSVPFGGGSGNKQQNWIENEYDNLERFDRIYLMLDMDDPGIQARNTILEAFGNEVCYIVELPKKDAGQCHQDGVDIMEFIQKAKTVDPEELKNAGDFRQDVWDEFYNQNDTTKGLKLPWPTIANNIRFRRSEVTVWTGLNGAGKSQVLGHIFNYFMIQDERCCIASMEMAPKKLLKRMYRQLACVNIPSNEDFAICNDFLSKYLWLFNIKGSAKSERIFDVFRYARKRYNVRQFLIDSMMKCGIRTEDLEAQEKFIEACCDLSEELDSHIHVVAHSKKLEDESKVPGKMDIKGSGGLSDMPDNVMSIWRNKPKEMKIDQCKQKRLSPSDQLLKEMDCVVYCFKQRHEDWEGSVGLYFDHNSYQYRDISQKEFLPYIRHEKNV